MNQKSNPLKSLLHNEITPSILLLGVTVLTLAFVNFVSADVYKNFLHLTTSFLPGHLNHMSFHHWVNDGLMAIFFFVVGLEIKREIISGELSSMKKASLPVIGALGGIILPIIIFLAVNPNPDADKGWAIPMATDIAFSLGIIKLLGNRVPTSLKVFLTAFAIADDLGAILVIAIAYTESISFIAIISAIAIVVVMFLLSKKGWYNGYLYLLLGCIVWYLFLISGVHATIAGVLVAFTIPMTSKDGKHSPVEHLEHSLHPWVGFFIMPIFAFANAGVVVGSEIAHFDVSRSIAAGLVIGKLVGVSSFCWLAIKVGLASMPNKANYKQLFATALLGGVGFTMSLFIAELSFDSTQAALLDSAKIGIMMGSLIAGVLGYFTLRASTEKG